jgi:hypothetical protein
MDQASPKLWRDKLFSCSCSKLCTVGGSAGPIAAGLLTQGRIFVRDYNASSVLLTIPQLRDEDVIPPGDRPAFICGCPCSLFSHSIEASSRN